MLRAVQQRRASAGTPNNLPPRSADRFGLEVPWQNPFVERRIGSIRRECLDHVIVLDERHLKRILRKYVDYYHSCRTHLSLEKDAPEPRRVESPAMGKVSAIPKVGGLHHYYTRRAA